MILPSVEPQMLIRPTNRPVHMAAFAFSDILASLEALADALLEQDTALTLLRIVGALIVALVVSVGRVKFTSVNKEYDTTVYNTCPPGPPPLSTTRLPSQPTKAPIFPPQAGRRPGRARRSTLLYYPADRRPR